MIKIDATGCGKAIATKVRNIVPALVVLLLRQAFTPSPAIQQRFEFISTSLIAAAAVLSRWSCCNCACFCLSVHSGHRTLPPPRRSAFIAALLGCWDFTVPTKKSTQSMGHAIRDTQNRPCGSHRANQAECCIMCCNRATSRAC